MRTLPDEHPLDFLAHLCCPDCDILLFHDQLDGYDCPSCGARVLCQTCGDNPEPGWDHCRACGAGECSQCGRPADPPLPLCAFHEGAARAAGRQLAEADRQRKVGHA